MKIHVPTILIDQCKIEIMHGGRIEFANFVTIETHIQRAPPTDSQWQYLKTPSFRITARFADSLKIAAQHTMPELTTEPYQKRGRSSKRSKPTSPGKT